MMILRLATQCAFFFHGLGYSSSSEHRGKAGSCGSASPNKSGQAVAGAFLLVTWVATKAVLFFLQESPIP